MYTVGSCAQKDHVHRRIMCTEGSCTQKDPVHQIGTRPGTGHETHRTTQIKISAV